MFFIFLSYNVYFFNRTKLSEKVAIFSKKIHALFTCMAIKQHAVVISYTNITCCVSIHPSLLLGKYTCELVFVHPVEAIFRRSPSFHMKMSINKRLRRSYIKMQSKGQQHFSEFFVAVCMY